MGIYKIFIKPLFFMLSPEKAHHFAISASRLILKTPIVGHFFRSLLKFESKNLETQVAGLHFRNPVGLAAGFDKDGKYLDVTPHLGFGFIEVGTVTPRPQDGNPKPRLFRLPQDNAIINRMGFNNEGVDALVVRLKRYKHDNIIIGGNIGKNKITENDKATEDYLHSYEKLYPYVDYFVVNISSPNTPGLRSLQDKEPLTKLLSQLNLKRKSTEKSKPIFLKIAPDLTDGQLDDIIEIVTGNNIDGIIATNTTIDRSGLKTDDQRVESIGQGGLSGEPLSKRSLEVVRYISDQTEGRLPIIGVGGISSPDDARAMLDAGASLVQIYTGLIYHGPGLVKSIKKSLA